VTRRIERRLALNRSIDIDMYVEQLRRDPRELSSLYEDLLIGVTQFFRDPDAFEVLERVGGYSLADTRDGGVAIRQRRGRSSLTNGSTDRPLLLLDNTLLSSASVLRQVRAGQIDRVEVLSGGEATARYGTGAAAGAILIFTRAY